MSGAISGHSLIISDISDQFPLMLWFANESVTTVPNQSRTFKPFSDTLTDQFDGLLREANWIPGYTAINAGDTNMAYDMFMTIYASHYNKTFVNSEGKTSKATPKKIWLTKGPASCIIEKEEQTVFIIVKNPQKLTKLNIKIIVINLKP